MKHESRICQNCKTRFEIASEDIAFYHKLFVPPPTFCPACRLKRRLSFFNERVLYKRNCDLCGKPTITMYAPASDQAGKSETKLTVYCPPCYWSDKWDPSSYAQDYDSSRPFLRQVAELIRTTPQTALSVNYPMLVNSDYVNHCGSAKNCYLIFNADFNENAMYSAIISYVKDSMDCMMVGQSELCYENIVCARNSRVFFSEDCVDSVDVYFSKYCRGCTDCFGCVNLRKKKYHIWNEPYTKEEYKKKLEEMNMGSRQSLQKLREQARAFWLTKPRPFMQSGSKSVNVSGEYVIRSKNSRDMYSVWGAEDSRYCQFLNLPTTKDAYDYTIWGGGAERVYECLEVGEGANEVKFNIQCWDEVLDVQYSLWVTNSSHMFGCANIRKKEYCILNKQYSKEDFEKLRAEIIRDMNARPYTDSCGRVYRYGEFFPPELSLHAYNETHANVLFPLSEAEARQQGFSWKTLPAPAQKPTIASGAVPDNIRDTPDSIVNEIIECASCARPFRIIPPELALLKRFGLPVPENCFNCRHLARWNYVNPPRLFDRTCMKCSKEIRTSYPPESPAIVYCENCYQHEVA